MSNTTDTTSCLSHRANSRFMVIYDDFLDIAKESEHQYKLAAFWRVLETKTNDRKKYNEELIEAARKKGLPEPETSLWIELTYSQFVDRALGLYKVSAFQIAAAESERMGLTKSRVLQRHRDPKDETSPLEDYKEYLLLTDVMQHALTTGELPPPVENNSPLLKSIAMRKERKRQQKEEKTAIENNTPLLISTGGAVEINTGAVDFNTFNNITEESYHDKDTVSATQSDDTDASASVSSPPSAPEPSLSDSQSDSKNNHPLRQPESLLSVPPPPVSPVSPVTQALTIPVAHHRTYLAWSEARAAFKRDLSAAWKADKADAAHPLQSEYGTFQRFSNEYLTRWYAANPQPPKAVPTQPAKPILPVLDEALQRRVDNTYACFDECARETTGEPDAAYARTPESTNAIVKALERKTPKLSRKRLRNCYRRLYDQPRGRNGWYCREHMEIWRVLEEYGNNPALGAPLERTPTSRESAPPPPPSREQLREESKRYALTAAGGGH